MIWRASSLENFCKSEKVTLLYDLRKGLTIFSLFSSWFSFSLSLFALLLFLLRVTLPARSNLERIGLLSASIIYFWGVSSNSLASFVAGVGDIQSFALLAVAVFMTNCCFLIELLISFLGSGTGDASVTRLAAASDSSAFWRVFKITGAWAGLLFLRFYLT